MQLNIFRKSYWRRRSNSHVLRQIRQSTDYFFTVSYRKNMRSELSRLCQKYGTDKGAINLDDHPKREGRIHNYADFYEMVFGGMRRHVKAVLECGIGQYSRGGSLRAWREYFVCCHPILDFCGMCLAIASHGVWYCSAKWGRSVL